MSDNENRTELHGCIVCGKTYSMLVIYSPAGKMIDCTVTSGDGHRVRDADRPLVACDTHSAAEIKAAYVRLQDIDKDDED